MKDTLEPPYAITHFISNQEQDDQNTWSIKKFIAPVELNPLSETLTVFDLLSFEQSTSFKNLDVELNPQKIEHESKVDPNLQKNYKNPINLRTSKTPSADILNRTEVLFNYGRPEMSEILVKGSSIDEGWIDKWEQFGSNYTQTDEAYGGLYDGIPIYINTYAIPEDQTVYRLRTKIVKSKNVARRFRIRYENVREEALLELQFRSEEEMNYVFNKFKKYDFRER